MRDSRGKWRQMEAEGKETGGKDEERERKRLGKGKRKREAR